MHKFLINNHIKCVYVYDVNSMVEHAIETVLAPYCNINNDQLYVKNYNVHMTKTRYELWIVIWSYIYWYSEEQPTAQDIYDMCSEYFVNVDHVIGLCALLDRLNLIRIIDDVKSSKSIMQACEPEYWN